MAFQKHNLRVPERLNGQRLDQIVQELLPESLKQAVSKSFVRKIILNGGVTIKQASVRLPQREIRGGTELEVWVDPEALEDVIRTQARDVELTADSILFEDEDLIVVNKPAGLPSQVTLDRDRNHLVAALTKLLQSRPGASGEPPYFGLHHRLDRDTSGVIALTKSKRANPGMAKQFESRTVQKTYWALCEMGRFAGELKPGHSWTIKNHLRKSKGEGKQSKMQATRSGGDFAHTDFKVLECGKNWAWIEAKPRTGRMHQIRVHLADAGWPIVGDFLYGQKHEKYRALLHAGVLSFAHPVTQAPLTIESPLPPDFEECLAELRTRK